MMRYTASMCYLITNLKWKEISEFYDLLIVLTVICQKAPKWSLIVTVKEPSP